MALGNTLWKIKQGFGKDIEPTVVWTGNGYHIYLPLQPLTIPLESDPMFSTFQNPSKEFLKFAVLYLADGKSDPNNKPTFASSLVRIPRSFNVKRLEDGRGLEESKVSILQKWNGIGPKMPLEMLTDFKGYLVSLKIQKLEEEQRQQQHYHSSSSSRHRRHHYANHRCKTTFPWIEKLLQTPIREVENPR